MAKFVLGLAQDEFACPKSNSSRSCPPLPTTGAHYYP